MSFGIRGLGATMGLVFGLATACGTSPDSSETLSRQTPRTAEDVFRSNPLCAVEDRHAFPAVVAGEIPAGGESVVLGLDGMQAFAFSIPAGSLPAAPWKACGIVVSFGHSLVEGSRSTVDFAVRRGLGLIEGTEALTAEPAETILAGMCEDDRCIQRSGRILNLFSPDHLNGSKWALTLTNTGDEAIEVSRPSLLVVGMKP